jgi:hypothetical protein
MATTTTPTISKDNPRTVRHRKTGAEVRCMDPGQYLELTSARGYRDVTDEATSSSSSSRRSRSSSSSSSTSSSASTDSAS